MLWNLPQTLIWIITRRKDFIGRLQNWTLWDLWKLIAQVPDGRVVSTRLGEAESHGELADRALGEAMRALTGELQNGKVGCVARLRNIGPSRTVDRDVCATWRFIDGPAGEEPRAVIDPLAVDEEWWGTLRFRIHADLPHPALGQDFTPSPTARRVEGIVSIWPAAIPVAKPGPKKGHATGKAGICEMAEQLLRDRKVVIGRGTTTRLAQIIHTEPIGRQYHPATIEKYIRPVVREISGKLLLASGK
jgi:hypothetical protein